MYTYIHCSGEIKSWVMILYSTCLVACSYWSLPGAISKLGPKLPIVFIHEACAYPNVP